jgi:iron complex transport system ATP-binding protein
MISAKGVSCGYGGKTVLENVTFTLGQSNVLVILGPNGAGKSTLLKTLAGLKRPLNGEVIVDGENIHDLNTTQRAQKIAWVSQSEKMEFAWTVEEYVMLGRSVRSAGFFQTIADKGVVRDCLMQVECADLAQRSILELSGGELQRVRIARGLAQESPLLMLDEPTAHLDIQHQADVLRLIHQLAEQGKNIVLSLHDLNQALALNAEYLVAHDQGCEFFAHREELEKTNLLNQVYKNSIEQIFRLDGSVALLPTYTIDSK